MPYTEEVVVVHIRRALVSVSDKSGLAEFSRVLYEKGVELISTGGTASFLRERNIPVIDISEYTGFPEILDGRVKTLHPRVHGGLLAIRDKTSHQAQMAAQNIQPIDMVIVNLYPFRETAAREGATYPEVIEQIDIGGPSMIRSAAKNHAAVAVVTDPRDYGWIMEEINWNNGALSTASCFTLAQKAFAATASYDSAIATWFSERVWSPEGAKKEVGKLPAIEVLFWKRPQICDTEKTPTSALRFTAKVRIRHSELRVQLFCTERSSAITTFWIPTRLGILCLSSINLLLPSLSIQIPAGLPNPTGWWPLTCSHETVTRFPLMAR